MKKITYLLIAAFVTLSVASCVKDQFEKVGPENPYGAEITVSLNPVTRTALEEGKTVWMEGDLLWVSNGAGVDTVAVPESAVGQQSFSFKTVNATPTEANPDVFIVYPATAASKVADGKVVVKVPGVQIGTFEAANICAGQSKEGVVSLRNVTGVLKVNVPAEPAAPVYQLVFSAVGETPLSGECTVDLSGNDPVVTSAKTSSSVTVQAGGFDGDFFAAVIPGTYEAGFKMTAATVDFEHASETKVSTVENTVGINEIVDLGTIGTDLKPLDGDGSDANPYLIENLGHLIALATAVDNGEESQNFEGQYFKVMEDVSGVSIPIGSSSHPFCGSFDGNGKTITLSMSGAQSYLGLFAALSYGASVNDLVIDGRINSSASYIGGLVGNVVAAKDSLRPQITNVTNKAVITGVSSVGGIAGLAGYTDFYNCVNQGELDADTSVGGIIGYSYYSNVTSSTNWGIITGKKDCGKVITLQNAAWGTAMSYLDGSSGSSYSSIPTNGIGGIGGWVQNSIFDDCVNNAEVTGVSKVAGIAGSIFWSTVRNCSNRAPITATQDFAGGISGWFYMGGNCLNDNNSGTISGRAAIGGIAGLVNGGTSNSIMTVKECTNAGEIISDYSKPTGLKHYQQVVDGEISAAGGIVGLAIESTNGSSHGYVQITSCVNDAPVTGKGSGVGGICGIKTAFLNSCQKGFIDKCVNNGAIESKRYQAGGILGRVWDRFTAGIFTVRNCANHGTVKAPFVAAGILGWAGHLWPNADSGKYGEKVINCYNDGDILYNKTAYADGSGPYAGGILGYSRATSAYNVISYGTVKPIEGDPNEYDIKCFALDLAWLGNYSYADYIYGLDSELPLIGTTSGTPVTIGANLAKVLEDGSFDKAVVINNVECEFPVDALNQWIAGVTDTPELYLEWKDGAKGPVFVE